MNVFQMVVLIVAIVSISAVLKARYGALHGRRAGADDDLPDRADVALMADEVRRLRERVGVLERIVTDPSATLGHQIDQLRDSPRD
jgi:hypothetical protein